MSHFEKAFAEDRALSKVFPQYQKLAAKFGTSFDRVIAHALNDWMETTGCAYIGEIAELPEPVPVDFSGALPDDPYNGLQLVHKAGAAD